jgi:hypothetical protein
MSDQQLLDFLPENPGAVVTNWREIRQKLHEASDHAATQEQRVAILAAYKAVMDIAENAAVHADDLETFRKARRQDYNLLVVKECMVGDNVCTDTAYAVTRREIAAGRMGADDELARGMELAVAAPHHTRDQLIEIDPRVAKAQPWAVIRQHLRC